MNTIEEVMNRLTEVNLGWWPFQFLKPNKDEYMTTMKVFKMSLYFGGFYGICIGVVLFTVAQNYNSLWQSIIFMVIIFFITYRSTFAYFWNRRARRLGGK